MRPSMMSSTVFSSHGALAFGGRPHRGVVGALRRFGFEAGDLVDEVEVALDDVVIVALVVAGDEVADLVQPLLGDVLDLPVEEVEAVPLGGGLGRVVRVAIGEDDGDAGDDDSGEDGDRAEVGGEDRAHASMVRIEW